MREVWGCPYTYIYCAAWGVGNIAEHQLGQFVCLAVPPDLHDIVYTLIDLGAGFVRQQLVDNALVKAQLAAIAGDLEHIVLRWVNRAAVYLGGTFGEGLHHFFLVCRRLGHNVVVFHLRRGKVELVSGLDVSNFAEQIHEFRQIEKLAESRSCPVAGAFRCQLQRRNGFSEAAGPAIKMGHVQLLQPLILEIPLHGVKLGHGLLTGVPVAKITPRLPVISSM